MGGETLKVLCVCDEGNNRSVHIAHLLQYTGHETIPVGARTSSEETRRMLADWCDVAVFTDEAQKEAFPPVASRVWPIADVHSRPFNPEQHRLVRRYISEDKL